MLRSPQEMVACRLYFDKTFQCEAVKILPGQYYVTNRDILISTVLGSCVSACIRDRVSGIGGMNHFMLPEGTGEASSPVSESARYGDYAMEMLINNLMKMGAARRNLEAKVFGGGNVMHNFTTLNVGERNARFVMEYLRNEDIPVAATDLADCHGRKIYYFPRTGKVLVNKMAVVMPSIINIEREYANEIKSKKVAGGIDLF